MKKVKKIKNKLTKKDVTVKQTKEEFLKKEYVSRVDELNDKEMGNEMYDPFTGKTYKVAGYDDYKNLTREEKVINKVCAILTKASMMVTPTQMALFIVSRDIFIKYLREQSIKRIVQTRYDNYKQLYKEYLIRNNIDNEGKNEDKKQKIHFGRKKITFENPKKHLSKRKVLTEIERLANEM